MKNTNLKIVYCGNDAMFKALYISMLTILRRTKSNIDFYCLSGDLLDLNEKYLGLTKPHEKVLDKLAKQYNKNNSFNVIDCSKLYKEAFLKFNDKFDVAHWTPYGIFRLFLAKVKIDGIVLYLDTDVLISGDIKEAFNVDMHDNELCVCHDLPHARKNHKMWFNAGVMLINVPQIKKTKLFDKAIQYCFQYQPKYWDQDALNLCWNKIRFWNDEYRFNFQPNCFGHRCRTKKPPVITHFYGKAPYVKPWDVDKFLKRLHKKKQYTWDRDYEILMSVFKK